MLVAFVTTGGTDLGPNTWTEIAATLLAAAAAAAVIVIGAPGRAWGGVTLLLFATLAALTFASIAWSVQPDNSWVEANRTVAYLAVFATALALARLLPERWRGAARRARDRGDGDLRLGARWSRCSRDRWTPTTRWLA